jgi:hypothetical protein
MLVNFSWCQINGAVLDQFNSQLCYLGIFLRFKWIISLRQQVIMTSIFNLFLNVMFISMQDDLLFLISFFVWIAQVFFTYIEVNVLRFLRPQLWKTCFLFFLYFSLSSSRICSFSFVKQPKQTSVCVLPQRLPLLNWYQVFLQCAWILQQLNVVLHYLPLFTISLQSAWSYWILIPVP